MKAIINSLATSIKLNIIITIYSPLKPSIKNQRST